MEQDIIFEPSAHRRLTLSNRTVMLPVCRYAAMDGLYSLWHWALRGPRTIGDEAGPVIVESTAVARPNGITPDGTGVYDDAQEQQMEVKGKLPLSHAGCYPAGLDPRWGGRDHLRDIEAPSPVKYGLAKTANELSLTEIAEIAEAFRRATVRARRFFLDVMVLYGEPSYLMHQFRREVHELWDMRLAFRQGEGHLV